MSNHLKPNRLAAPAQPVDHRQTALDKQDEGDIYGANLHALLYIGGQLERLAEASEPVSLHFEVQTPEAVAKALAERGTVTPEDLADHPGFDALANARRATGGPIVSTPADPSDPGRYKTRRLMGGAH